MKIEEIYKQIVENSTVEPPADAWENISDSLDIDQTWDRISAQLDKKAFYLRLRKAAVYTSAALVALVILFYSNNTTFKSKTDLVINKNEVGGIAPAGQEDLTQSNFTLNNSKKSINQNQPKTSFSNEKHLTANKIKSGTKQEKISDTLKNKLSPDISNYQPSILKIIDKKINHLSQVPEISKSISTLELVKNIVQRTNQNTVNKVINSLPENHEIGQIANKEGLIPNTLNNLVTPYENQTAENAPQITNGFTSHKGVFIGTYTSASNVWLMNPKTFEGLQGEDLVQTLPVFSYSYGFAVGYMFSPNLSVQVLGRMSDKYGQKYKEYVDGKYQSEYTRLVYKNISILAAYTKPSKISRYNYERSIIAGINIGKLESATTTLGNTTQDISSYCYKTNPSITAGYELSFYPDRKLSIFLGFRVNYGLKSAILPNKASLHDNTKTASYGVNFGTRFHL
jgi:hypothetical protein